MFVVPSHALAQTRIPAHATGMFVCREYRRLGFEGVVAKKLSSEYRPGKHARLGRDPVSSP